MKEKRIEAIAWLEEALAEIESGEGLSTFVEGHGLQSHRFRFDWSEPSLNISYDLPTGRVLSPEDDQHATTPRPGRRYAWRSYCFSPLSKARPKLSRAARLESPATTKVRATRYSPKTAA